MRNENSGEKECVACRKMFARKSNYSIKQWKLAKFCTKECWEKRGQTETKNCDQCGKQFSLPAHLMRMGDPRERRSCSKECQYLLTAGQKSTMWKGGASVYNLRFRDALSNTVMYRKWRSDIKRRDGKCVNCGELKDSMHVHHIYPLAKIVKDEGWTYERWTELYKAPESRLWDRKNGVMICSDCHSSLISFALEAKGFSPQ